MNFRDSIHMKLRIDLKFKIQGEDFYEFSCGSYIKNKRIPDEEARLEIFNGLRDTLAYNLADLLTEPIDSKDTESITKAKQLFASCMNEGKPLK